MAKTKLIIPGFAEREVSSFAMAFNQPIDAMGQVTGVPRGGQITMRLKAINDSGSGGQLFKWMIDKGEFKTGDILFVDPDNKRKEIHFDKALCVNYIEYWEDQESVTNPKESPNASLGHWEEITISCLKITNSFGGEFNSNWDLEEKDDNPYYDD